MSIVTTVFRFYSRLRGSHAIALVGEARPNGYMFLKSPDLPGFSYMLSPGEYDDISAVFKTIGEPLKAFINAEHKAWLQSRKVRITGTRQADSTTYLAELSAA